MNSIFKNLIGAMACGALTALCAWLVFDVLAGDTILWWATLGVGLLAAFSTYIFFTVFALEQEVQQQAMEDALYMEKLSQAREASRSRRR